MSNTTKGPFMQAMEKYTKSIKTFISAQGFGHYSKPNGGIPKTDLEQSVQTSLGKADSALQSFTESDPTVPSWAKASTKPSYTQDEVGDGTTYKRVSATEKNTWNNKGTYSKPNGGIPKTDLDQSVQTSLGKADSALQSFTESDPTVPAWAKASSKPSYTASEVGAVPNTSAGVSAAINQLTTGDSAPTDNDYYVSQYAGGGTSTTTYHRRPVSKLWEYIKSKLASKGSATQPVYFSNGVPVATTYTLGKSVPSDAKFTDTTYSAATTSAAGLMSAADKTKLNGIATGAQVNSITGVKGNAESSYRTGNVNLTAANIGAAASSHTHNYAGSSSAGGAATSANKLNTNAGSATKPVYFSNGVPVATTSPSGFTKFSTLNGSEVVSGNETGGFAVYGPIVFIDDIILIGSGTTSLKLFNISVSPGSYPAGAPLPPIHTYTSSSGLSSLDHGIPVYDSNGVIYPDAYLALLYYKNSSTETYKATLKFTKSPSSNVYILINFSYIGKL